MAQVQRRLSDLISDVSTATQARVRKGFAIATRLPADVREKAITDFLSAYEKGAAFAQLDSLEGVLSPSEGANFVAALSVIVGVLSQCPASAEDFAQEGRGKLFDPSDDSVVMALANLVINKRTQLERSVESRLLAVETLPALTALDITIDLRFRFGKAGIQDAVPVALVHVDTDAEPEIWFQMTEGDVDAMQQKLAEAKDWMEQARKFYDQAKLAIKK